jgi:hypothetical protein
MYETLLSSPPIGFSHAPSLTHQQINRHISSLVNTEMRPSSLLLALHLVIAAPAVIAMANAEESMSTVAIAAPEMTSLAPPAAVVSPPSSAPSPPVNLPAWSPVVDVTNRSIQQVGRFAVVAYFFKTGTKLEFVNVVSCQTKPYNGGNSYRLVITVAGPGTKTARYSTSVWGILGTTRWQLWSFAPN